MMTETSIIEQERDSGCVSWTDAKIEWQNPNGADVMINIEDVMVIGEYTTDAGPFFDDWFLVFVYKTGDWGCISIYADGIDLLKQHLSKIYDTDFSKYFLTNSIEWRSYIIYPHDLEGKPLFMIHPPKGYNPPETFLQKLQSAFGLGKYGKSWDFELSNEVKSKLKNNDGG